MEKPRSGDELLLVLTLAYNTQPHRSTATAPIELVVPRRVPGLSVRNVPPATSMSNHRRLRDGSPLAAKRAFMARLRDLMPQVAPALRKTQHRYKRLYDRSVVPDRAGVAVGDYVYTVAHRRVHKLTSPTVGPFLVKDRDDKTVVIQKDDEEERLSLDQVTPAPRPDATGSSPVVPHALLQDRVGVATRTEPTDDDLIHGLSGMRTVDGEPQLRVRWYEYWREEDFWEPVAGLPRNLVIRYQRRTKQVLPGYEWSPRARGRRLARRGRRSVETVVDQGRPASPAGPSHDSVRTAVIARLEVLYGPHTVDLIATVATVQYLRYYGTGPLGVAVGYDALVHPWDEENAWAIPPVGRLNDVAARIEVAPVDLSLLVPRCPQAPWYSVFLRRS